MSHLPGASTSLRGLDARLLLPALAGWALLVICLDRSSTTHVVISGGAAVLAFGAWWLRDRGRWAAPVALAGVVCALLTAGTAAHISVRTAGPIPELARTRAVVTVIGVVAQDPVLLRAGPERRVDRVITRLDAHEVVGRGQQVAVGTPILVMGDASWAQVRWHEEVRVVGRLGPADEGDDVVALLTPLGPPRVLSGAGTIAEAAEHVRSRLRAAVADLPEDPRGLIPGLVIGDTSLSPSTLTDDMRATGMTHLSAVSGSNVAVVLAAALALARVLSVPRRLRPVVAAALLVAFVVVARPEPSVLRAAVMGGVGLIGMSQARRGAGPSALGAAIVVLLLFDPWLARSFGFALSSLATLGLLVFARPWGAAIASALPPRWGWLGEAIAIPVAAQVMCAPAIVLLQGSVSVIGVLANLLAAPMVAPATVLGVAAALAAAVWVPAGVVSAWLAAAPAWLISVIAHRCAVVPFGRLPWPDTVVGGLALAVLTVFLLFAWPWLIAHALRRPGRSLTALAVSGALVVPPPLTAWPDPAWSFVACDIGQGDALVLRSGPTSAVVVDVGPPASGVAGCLHRLGVARVDAVVLTHFHDDHAGGLAEVLTGWAVPEVYVGPVDDPPADAARVRSLAAEAGLAVTPVGAGDVLRWGTLTIRVCWPRGRLSVGSVPNNNSLVLDADADGMRVVLLADIEREAAAQVRRDLAGSGAQESVDVVKVAHHGSANQDPALVEWLAPRAFVISVGADNDFGHPAPSLLTTLAHVGAPVFRTDRDGDVLVALHHGWPSVARSRRAGCVRRAKRRPR